MQSLGLARRVGNFTKSFNVFMVCSWCGLFPEVTKQQAQSQIIWSFARHRKAGKGITDVTPGPSDSKLLSTVGSLRKRARTAPLHPWDYLAKHPKKVERETVRLLSSSFFPSPLPYHIGSRCQLATLGRKIPSKTSCRAVQLHVAPDSSQQ